MTSIFNKLVCATTGASMHKLNTTTQASQTKLKALTIAATIPALMWASSMFLLLWKTMGSHIMVAIFGALVAAFLIFTLERIIIMSSKHWLLFIVRIMLAGVVAFIGSILFELPFFATEIQQQMPTVRHGQAMKAAKNAQKRFEEQQQVGALQSRANELEAIFQERQNDAVGEAAGMAGSGKKGAGSATRFKQQVANNAAKQAAEVQAQLHTVQANAAQLAQRVYDSANANFNGAGIIFQKQALSHALQQNPDAKWFFWAITSLLFMLEFMVVLLKLCWHKTAYELETEMLDKLHQERTLRFINPENDLLSKVHHSHPQIAATSKALSINAHCFL